MLVAELPRQIDHETEAFIEQATRRIVSAFKRCQWRLGISPHSIGDPEYLTPGCVYQVALLCRKRTHWAPFTLGDWPPTLLPDQPHCIPDKLVDHYKTWQRLDEELGTLPVTVRLQEDEDSLVRRYLPAKPLSILLTREVVLDYSLVGTLDVSTQASPTNRDEITFPGRQLALHQILR